MAGFAGEGKMIGDMDPYLTNEYLKTMHLCFGVYMTGEDFERTQDNLPELISTVTRMYREDHARLQELERIINTPATENFITGVQREMAHQSDRWRNTDPHKTHADWFWLISHLAGKALNAIIRRDPEKARHHIITAAAALGNWMHHFDQATSNSETQRDE